MYLSKRVWITLVVILVVAIIGAVVAVTLVYVLRKENVCGTREIFEKISARPGLRSHVEKTKWGPPPLEGISTRAQQPDIDWITQRIDHFDPTNKNTWQMRYMNNSEFYEEGGPMFIFLGGEWVITASYLMTGQMYDMAEEHRGYMFYTEHRYYGESFPTADLSTSNLQFLSADQALADIAYFIEYQKSTIPGMETSKVVVVGGSYSAMLATWMRVKYPHLVDAAFSSSAPLRAIADFYQYYEVVSDSLKLESEECVETIAAAFTEIESCLEVSDGPEYVSNILGMQNKIDTTEPSRSYFFSMLGSPFAGLVQYASGSDLERACQILLSFNGTAFDKYISYVNWYYAGYTMTDYNYYVNYLDNSALTTAISRQWYYQTCTEYGFYQTSASNNQPFKGYELDLYLNLCTDVFGIPPAVLNTGVERSNLFYGSIYPEVTKVVSTHGTIDPWHALGVLEDINDEAPVFVINGASHCADLSSISAADSDELRLAKTRVKEYIAEWIQ